MVKKKKLNLNAKGFISVYALLLLNVVVLMSYLLQLRIKNIQLLQKQGQSFAIGVRETIEKIKEDYLSFTEENCEIETNHGLSASIVYEGLEARVRLYDEAHEVCYRLYFDDLEEVFLEFEYIDCLSSY